MSTDASGGWMRSALAALLVVVASCAGETEARVSASPSGMSDDDTADRPSPRCPATPHRSRRTGSSIPW